MLYPSIDELMKKLDSKYTLVSLVAKRAREIRDHNNGYIEKPFSHKHVGQALEEFVADHITYKTTIQKLDKYEEK